MECCRWLPIAALQAIVRQNAHRVRIIASGRRESDLAKSCKSRSNIGTVEQPGCNTAEGAEAIEPGLISRGA